MLISFDGDANIDEGKKTRKRKLFWQFHLFLACPLLFAICLKSRSFQASVTWSAVIDFFFFLSKTPSSETKIIQGEKFGWGKVRDAMVTNSTESPKMEAKEVGESRASQNKEYRFESRMFLLTGESSIEASSLIVKMGQDSSNDNHAEEAPCNAAMMLLSVRPQIGALLEVKQSRIWLAMTPGMAGASNYLANSKGQIISVQGKKRTGKKDSQVGPSSPASSS